MKIAFGADDETELTEFIVGWLKSSGHEVLELKKSLPWPDVGREVGEAVAEGRAERGIVCCWTGTGVSIAANKVPGVRAALCGDPETARGARKWNDANILAMSLRLTSSEIAKEMIEEFLATDPDKDELGEIAKLK